MRHDLGRTIGSVSFAPEMDFGNDMPCSSRRSPLYSTYKGGIQKMVDTSISCDAMYLLREEVADCVLIASDDDDFLPAIFTAEAWGLNAISLRFDDRDIAEVTDNVVDAQIYAWGKS